MVFGTPCGLPCVRPHPIEGIKLYVLVVTFGAENKTHKFPMFPHPLTIPMAAARFLSAELRVSLENHAICSYSLTLEVGERRLIPKRGSWQNLSRTFRPGTLESS